MLHSVPERLAKALLDLCRPGRSGCDPGAQIVVPMRQKTFASLLGTSRETLNKQLHASQAEGLILLRRGPVVIEKPDALVKLARPAQQR